MWQQTARDATSRRGSVEGFEFLKKIVGNEILQRIKIKGCIRLNIDFIKIYFTWVETVCEQSEVLLPFAPIKSELVQWLAPLAMSIKIELVRLLDSINTPQQTGNIFMAKDVSCIVRIETIRF